MGFLGKALGFGGGGDSRRSTPAADAEYVLSERTCPDCGAQLWTNAPGVAYVCRAFGCDALMLLDRGGELEHQFPLSELPGASGTSDTCDWCQASLATSERNLPYEDGSTPYASIICRSCGGENVREGFGFD